MKFTGHSGRLADLDKNIQNKVINRYIYKGNAIPDLNTIFGKIKFTN